MHIYAKGVGDHVGMIGGGSGRKGVRKGVIGSQPAEAVVIGKSYTVHV
jgi:hypothetical protein